jgi:hypothetical protein
VPGRQRCSLASGHTLKLDGGRASNKRPRHGERPPHSLLTLTEVIAIIGIILLIGIVKNGIMLVDFALVAQR